MSQPNPPYPPDPRYPNPYPVYLYQQPQQPQNGMAISGLVLGIVATVFSFIPFGIFFFWPAGILAIIFGAVGHSKANSGQSDKKRAAIAGWVLGIVSLVLAPILWFALFAAAMSTGG